MWAPPEPAAASSVAERRCAAAKGSWSFNHRLQRRTLPHQTGGFLVVPAARQLIWWECRTQGRERKRERKACDQVGLTASEIKAVQGCKMLPLSLEGVLLLPLCSLRSTLTSHYYLLTHSRASNHQATVVTFISKRAGQSPHRRINKGLLLVCPFIKLFIFLWNQKRSHWDSDSLFQAGPGQWKKWTLTGLKLNTSLLLSNFWK